MEQVAKKGFSSGYKIHHRLLNNKKTNNKKDKDKDLSYPNGMVPFILISVVFIIILCCVLGIGFGVYPQQFQQKHGWTNSILAASCVPICFDLLWFVGRSGLTNILSFSILKLSRSTKASKLREKMEFYVQEPAIKDVETFQDFKDFHEIRKTHTKKWCFISLIVHTIVFIVVLIIALSIQLT